MEEMVRMVKILTRTTVRQLKRSRWKPFLVIFGTIWLFSTLLSSQKEKLPNHITSDEDKYLMSSNFLEANTSDEPVLTYLKDIPYMEEELSTWSENEDDFVIVHEGSNETESQPGQPPGDLGRPYDVPDKDMRAAKKQLREFSVNLMASEAISSKRRLPDYRESRCRHMKYNDKLPTVTVIIIFHNEALSVLQRTIQSVINRTPPTLLREFIFVDDSSKSDLTHNLESFLRDQQVVYKIKRLKSREGLIVARLEGAKMAKSPVLVFLDAHIEVTPGWLPPLVAQIQADRTTLAVPRVHTISNWDFQFDFIPNDRERSGFDWKFYQSWIEADHTISNRSIQPFATPTMIGCAFAVDREFFFSVGSYDSGMKIWGAENVEQSIRTWLCGGQVLIVPCSIVGHLFREKSPHIFPGGLNQAREIIHRNNGRFISVWMNDYYKFYKKLNPSGSSVFLGNLKSRMKLKSQLKCRPFSWYLDHIYPDNPLPYNHTYVGGISLKNGSSCLESVGMNNGNPHLSIGPCHGLGKQQVWIFKMTGHIQQGNYCLKKYNNTNVILDICPTNMMDNSFLWHRTNDGQIRLGVDPQLRERGNGEENSFCLTYRLSTGDIDTSKRTKHPAILNLLQQVLTSRPAGSEPPLRLAQCQAGQAGQVWQLDRPLQF